MTIVNSNSPLRLDEPMSDGLIEMATWGQPVVATPFTLAGAMTPVTLAGALAQQHAEALFMVALAQIVRPGTPMVYGGFTSNVDMRTGSPAFGTPEYVKAALATGQLARRCGLPHRSSNVTGSAVVDAQAAYESEMSIWGSVLGGASLLYQGAGWLEGGLTASFEKLILDAELLQQMAEVLVPFPVDDDVAGARRDRRGGARRALLRHGPHAGEIRDGLLPADAVRLAELRDVAGGRRAEPRPSARTGSGSSCSPSTSRRRWTPARPRRSTRSSTAASARSCAAPHDGACRRLPAGHAGAAHIGELPANVEVLLVRDEPEPLPDLAGVDLVVPLMRIRPALLELLAGPPGRLRVIQTLSAGRGLARRGGAGRT